MAFCHTTSYIHAQKTVDGARPAIDGSPGTGILAIFKVAVVRQRPET
jgi:hypothetical protein